MTFALFLKTDSTYSQTQSKTQDSRRKSTDIKFCNGSPRPSPNVLVDLSRLHVALLHTDIFLRQVHSLNEYLIRLGFSALNLRGQQEAVLDNFNISVQGLDFDVCYDFGCTNL